MKATSPSKTAEFVASAKALETLLPGIHPCLNDKNAIYFASRSVRFMRHVPFIHHLVKIILGDRIPGLHYCVARAKFMRDYIEEIMRRGIDQLVILGAGYDTLCFKSETKTPNIKIYELDHPATQKRKLRIIKDHHLELCEGTQFIKHDLMRDNLHDSLDSAGFNFKKPTLFSMSGVSMYLPEQTNHSIMDFISHKMQAGSFFIFDILCDSENSAASHRQRTLMRRVKRYKEDIVWQPAIDVVQNLMMTYGFRGVTVVRPSSLRKKYYQFSENGTSMDPFFSIIYGETSSEYRSINQ